MESREVDLKGAGAPHNTHGTIVVAELPPDLQLTRFGERGFRKGIDAAWQINKVRHFIQHTARVNGSQRPGWPRDFGFTYSNAHEAQQTKPSSKVPAK